MTGTDACDLYARIDALQDQLRHCRLAHDKAGEISALLDIANAALEQDSGLAMMHFRLAEKVIGPRGPRLHEAIGGQGRVLRRARRFEDAIARFTAAEQAAAAGGNLANRVRWMLARASANRAAGDAAAASRTLQEADALLRPPPPEGSPAAYLGPVNLADREEVATLAELEGQIGLDFAARHDEENAEDHYRSAWQHSQSIQDWDAVHTWARNAGNVCARLSRYGEALACHEAALAAARKAASPLLIASSAASFADVHRSAFRHEDGGDRLHALAGELIGHARMRVLDHALGLYDDGLCAIKALAVLQEIDDAVADERVSDEFRARTEGIRERMQRLVHMAPNATGPAALDLYLPHVMARAMERKDALAALDAAHLVCDVRLGLALRGGREWSRLVSGDMLEEAGLDLRVVTDALRLLVDQDENDRVADLLQRYKAPAFCIASVRRLWQAPPDRDDLRALADATRQLADAVAGLAGVAQPDFMRVVHAVRRAGERMREAGEAIRAVDPLLHARFGLSVRREDLIDALPVDEGIAIVDFAVARDATLGAIYMRGTEGVVVSLLDAPTFTVTEVRELTKLHAGAQISNTLGGQQMEAVLGIAKILHEHLFCKLAQMLSARGVTQLILVPDLLTRGLPLHLSIACGSEFSIPGIDTSDASFLCEVMPVEYVPAVQAVAASQRSLRPRALSAIAGFADPRGDLVGARVALEDFGTRVGKGVRWTLATGPEMTRAAVSDAVATADMVVFGTHGRFAPGDLKSSHLVMHDEPWSLEDMLRLGELDGRALMVLVACEAGAVAISPDEGLAWGIPGALLSAGASAVVANLWPVVDITANLLLGRFLVHLGHRGYRPSAALFRAVRDLRRMPRSEALAACRAHYELLKARKAEPRAIMGARRLTEWVEDTDASTPFAHPFFWGATSIVGSGWHLPAGGQVGNPIRVIENVQRLADASTMLSGGKPRAALDVATRVAWRADGAQRGRAYVMMADALIRSSDLTIAPRVRRRARRLLDAAGRIARAEEDAELQRWVEALYRYTEDDDVDQHDG